LVGQPGLQHTGSDAAQHMVSATTFQDHSRYALPSRSSFWLSSNPAGPPPMIATCVRTRCLLVDKTGSRKPRSVVRA
jgi:hypothetical protein